MSSFQILFMYLFHSSHAGTRKAFHKRPPCSCVEDTCIFSRVPRPSFSLHHGAGHSHLKGCRVCARSGGGTFSLPGQLSPLHCATDANTAESVCSSGVPTSDAAMLCSWNASACKSMGFKFLYSGFETCFGWDPRHLGAGSKTHLKSRFCAILKEGERCYNLRLTVLLYSSVSPSHHSVYVKSAEPSSSRKPR